MRCGLDKYRGEIGEHGARRTACARQSPGCATHAPVEMALSAAGLAKLTGARAQSTSKQNFCIIVRLDPFHPPVDNSLSPSGYRCRSVSSASGKASKICGNSMRRSLLLRCWIRKGLANNPADGKTYSNPLKEQARDRPAPDSAAPPRRAVRCRDARCLPRWDAP